MKRTILCSILVGFFTAPVHAWNAPIHMAVVELALDQLTPGRSQEFNNIAYDLIAEFEQDRRLTLMRQYEGTSWLAQLSVIPDWDREVLLEDLFARYELEVPEPLAAERASNTANWHYINRALANGAGSAQCSLTGSTNLVSVMPLLLDSYELAGSDKARALILSFIVHLVADAHQPLHNLTRANQDCSHDAGGNAFCVSGRSQIQRCEESLHQLWDRALGLFEGYELVEEVADTIGLARVDQELASDMDIQHWSDESYRYGQFVYSTSENRQPDSTYLDLGQGIAAERLVLAAHRLAELLRTL